MNYREFDPPGALSHLVRKGWTLDVPGEASDWISHEATPDGCIEIIRRLAGRSRWDGEQPEVFVAGLATRPARLELGGGARFVAIRLWPWTWNALGRIPCRELADRWCDLSDAAPAFAMPRRIEDAMTLLSSLLLDAESAELAAVIPGARGVEDLARRSGWPRRRLQRWFKREIGIPPRQYLRLLRFQEALAGMQADGGGGLADHAAAFGFADQAHMAREFRSIAGETSGVARRKAIGPFI